IQALERLLRWCRRNPKITVTGLLMLVLLLCWVLSGVWVFSRLADERRAAESREAAAVARAEKLREALARALAAGSALAGNEPSSPADLVRLAESCAVAASLIEDDAAQAEQYAQTAVHLLRKAKAAGWFRDPDHIDQLRKAEQ